MPLGNDRKIVFGLALITTGIGLMLHVLCSFLPITITPSRSTSIVIHNAWLNYDLERQNMAIIRSLCSHELEWS